MSDFEERLESSWKAIHFGTLEEDTFENAKKVHDWRNHVPHMVKEHWSSLSKREKMLVAVMAERAAIMEEWE